MKELKLVSETEEGTQKIYKAFMSFNVVSSACISIINTKLNAPAVPEPWFYELQNELNESVKKAESWLNDIAIDIQYKIPQYVINYSDEYIKTSNSINEIITKNPSMQKGDEAFNEVMNKLQSLLDFSNNMLNNDMKQVLSSISNIEKDFRDIGSQMKVTISKAQESEIEIRGDIDRLNSHISYLENLIQQENEKIEEYTGSKCDISMVAGEAVIFVVSPILGGIVAGISALFGKKNKKKAEKLRNDITEQLREIQKDQQMISEDKQFLASLQGIEMSTNNTISSLENASKSVNDIQVIWEAFISILEGVINDLSKAEESPVAIIKKVFTKAALNQWEDIYKFAKNLISTNSLCLNTEVSFSLV